MDSEALRHMTFNKNIFNEFQEQDVGIQVELGDNVAYSVIRMGSIAFWMPSSDVLKLQDVLFVPSLTKNLLFVLARSQI